MTGAFSQYKVKVAGFKEQVSGLLLSVSQVFSF